MKNIDKKLPRICFIGCGTMAARHAKIIKKLYPSLEISFASRNKKKSREYVDSYNGKFNFGNYEEALISNLFDIAFITTPHALHSKIAVLAANNNKDIIIEKPVSRSLRELLDIKNAVKRNKVRCTVAENYYYKPFIKKINKYILEGLIGDVLFINLCKTGKNKISGWRANKEMMGGGALLEGGVHWVNELVSLSSSSPVEVIAVKPDIIYKTDVPFEDTIVLNVKFKNGVIGNLLHSWHIINPLRGLSLSKIYGTEGLITFESNGLFFSVHGRKKRIILNNPFDFLGFKSMHKSFINDYMNGNTWQPSLDRIEEELRLIECAYKSLKSKRIEILK